MFIILYKIKTGNANALPVLMVRVTAFSRNISAYLARR